MTGLTERVSATAALGGTGSSRRSGFTIGVFGLLTAAAINLPLLYIFTAFALFGMVIDLKLRYVHPEPTPQLPWVLLFFAWTAGSAMLRHPDPLRALTDLAILFTWYFLISHGLQSLRAFESMVRIVVVLALFLCVVGIHQHWSPKGCVAIQPDAQLSVFKEDIGLDAAKTVRQRIQQTDGEVVDAVVSHVLQRMQGDALAGA